jgi:hypothetical protein
VIVSTYGFECAACGTTDDGWDDYAGAVRAEIRHLEKCGDPDAPEILEETRELLAREITGKRNGDG